MGKETKEKILNEALVSFAENGYKGTNLRDFAAGIGLSKSALYRHFESKEAIWTALLDQMEAYYSEHFGSPAQIPQTPHSCEDLYTLTMHMVDFTIHDEKVILTRKLLLTEQFHDERVKKLATAHFLTDTREMFRRIFAQMTEENLLVQEDADLLAFLYTAPITSLIHYCDREPERETEILQQVSDCIRHFIKKYGVTA